MNFRDYISIDRIKMLETTDKDNCLNELVNIFGPECKDKELLKEAIFHRETLMSTGIGLGIGIPHVRTEFIKSIAISVGVQKAGIDNYESIDEEPVKLVFMIIANKDQHKEHIKILSSLMTKLKEKDVIDDILACESVNELYAILRG